MTVWCFIVLASWICREIPGRSSCFWYVWHWHFHGVTWSCI